MPGNFQGREWIAGRHPVYEVLQAGRRSVFRLLVAEGAQEKGRVTDILELCQRRKIPVETAPRSRLDTLGDHHQGVLLQTVPYPYGDLADVKQKVQKSTETPFILILDALQDPQNLGTLLRTAEIVGVHSVLMPLRHTATITPAVVSASSGATEHLLIVQANLAQAIRQLKEENIWVVGLDAGPQAQTPDRINLDIPLALVVGSEGQGMRQLVEKSCDMVMRLPMRGRIDSLNAAVAGSVALYLAWQARGFNSGSG